MIDEVDTSCPWCDSENTRTNVGYGCRAYPLCRDCGVEGPAIAFKRIIPNKVVWHPGAPPLDVAIERAYNKWHEQAELFQFLEIIEEQGESALC